MDNFNPYTYTLTPEDLLSIRSRPEYIPMSVEELLKLEYFEPSKLYHSARKYITSRTYDEVLEWYRNVAKPYIEQFYSIVGKAPRIELIELAKKRDMITNFNDLFSKFVGKDLYYNGGMFQVAQHWFNDPEKKKWNRHINDPERQFWEEFCILNKSNWITSCHIWKLVFQEVLILEDYAPLGIPLFLQDELKRGFLLLEILPDENLIKRYGGADLYAHFGLVDEEHRRRGVMHALMSKASLLFPGKKIWLETQDPVPWRALGFLPSKCEPNTWDEKTPYQSMEKVFPNP